MKKISDSWPIIGQLEYKVLSLIAKLQFIHFPMSSGAGVTQTTVFVDGRNSKVCAKDTLIEMETFGN